MNVERPQSYPEPQVTQNHIHRFGPVGFSRYIRYTAIISPTAPPHIRRPHPPCDGTLHTRNQRGHILSPAQGSMHTGLPISHSPSPQRLEPFSLPPQHQSPITPPLLLCMVNLSFYPICNFTRFPFQTQGKSDINRVLETDKFNNTGTRVRKWGY